MVVSEQPIPCEGGRGVDVRKISSPLAASFVNGHLTENILTYS